MTYWAVLSMTPWRSLEIEASAWPWLHPRPVNSEQAFSPAEFGVGFLPVFDSEAAAQTYAATIGAQVFQMSEVTA